MTTLRASKPYFKWYRLVPDIKDFYLEVIHRDGFDLGSRGIIEAPASILIINQGARTLGNLVFLVILLFGFAFTVTGVCSLFKVNLLNYLFQGIAMVFYGVAAVGAGFFIAELCWFNIGFGFVYFNLQNEKFYICYNGFPGITHEVDGKQVKVNSTEPKINSLNYKPSNLPINFLSKKELTNKVFECYSFGDIKSVKMLIKQGLNPQRLLFICLTSGTDIPLTGSNGLIRLREFEKLAKCLSDFLKVPLELEFA